MIEQAHVAVGPSAPAPDYPRPETDVMPTPVVVVAAPPVNTATVIPIASISTGRRLRELREDFIVDLITSISRIGVQQPITVVQVAGDETAFELIAGCHRLEACRRLKLIEVPAIVATLCGDERLLWELDENLCRAELTELERAEHLLERQSIYERLHPETRQHVAGAHAANAAMSRGDATADSAVASFGADTETKTGIAARTIRQSTRRARKISKPARDRVRGNLKIANNGSQLDALGSLPPADQERAIDLVEDGTCADIKAAKLLLTDASVGGSVAAGKRPPSTAPDQSSDPSLDDERRELIDLLFKATLLLETIPDAEKIENLLRCCQFGDYADQLSRHGLIAGETAGSKAA